MTLRSGRGVRRGVEKPRVHRTRIEIESGFLRFAILETPIIAGVDLLPGPYMDSSWIHLFAFCQDYDSSWSCELATILDKENIRLSQVDIA